MANIQRLGQAKPRTWDDGSTVSNASAIGDGTIAEAMAALGYGWNATSSTWAKLPVDNATGALKVLAAGSSAVTVADGADVAQGTTTDASSANTVVGILKAIKAAVTGSLTVVGNIASGSADSGNPVKVGGVYRLFPSSLTDGQRSDHITDAKGSLRVTLQGTDGLNGTSHGAQADSTDMGVTPTLRTFGFGLVYNVATGFWDRMRGDSTNGTWVNVKSSVAVPVTDNSGSLTVDAPVGTPVFSRLSDGAAALIGQKAMASSLPVAIASDQSAVGVTPPTLTKGTQGATGFSVQDLKDSGRVNIAWTAEFAFAQVAETLLTITESRDGAATTTFTTKVVTSGKRLRITSVQMEVESLGTGTTPQRAYLRMRFNTAGAATTGSPLQGVWGLGVTTAIVKASEKEAWSFPDGIEFLGDGTKQIGFSLETPDWVVTTATGRAKITITAFEY